MKATKELKRKYVGNENGKEYRKYVDNSFKSMTRLNYSLNIMKHRSL